MGDQRTLSAKQALDIASNAAASGDKEKAIKYFEAVLAKYPDNKEAIEGFKKLNPNSLFRSDIDDLKALFKAGEYREVEVRSKMYLELYSEVQELHSLLGATLGFRKAHEEALVHFKKAAELSPLVANVQYNLGNGYKECGELEKALACFKLTVELDEKHAPAYNNGGTLLMARKDYDNAIELFTAAARLAPYSVEVLINLASAYKEKGEYEIAIAHYNRVIELDDTRAYVFLELAMCQKLNGNPDEAKKIYEVVTEQEPENYDAHNNFAILLQQTGEVEAAISHFEKAIDIHPEMSVSYNNLGNLYRETGRFDKAISLLGKAREISPEATEFIVNLADVEKARGDYSVARGLYEDAFKKLPTGPVCITNLVILNVLLGDDDQAEKYLKLLDDEFIENIDDLQKRQVCSAYKIYMTGLLDFNKKAERTNDGEKLWVLGNIDSLATKGLKLSINDQDLVADAKWIHGAKAFHFGKDGNNRFKASVKHHLSEMVEDTNVLYMFGSIDCRLDEGVLAAARKTGKDASELVTETVSGYFKNTHAMSVDEKVIPSYCAVSAPLLENDAEGADDLVAVIKQFNSELKALCDEQGLTFVDTYALTDSGEGRADGSKHLDPHHLNPSAISEALAL